MRNYNYELRITNYELPFPPLPRVNRRNRVGAGNFYCHCRPAVYRSASHLRPIDHNVFVLDIDDQNSHRQPTGKNFQRVGVDGSTGAPPTTALIDLRPTSSTDRQRHAPDVDVRSDRELGTIHHARVADHHITADPDAADLNRRRRLRPAVGSDIFDHVADCAVPAVLDRSSGRGAQRAGSIAPAETQRRLR